MSVADQTQHGEAHDSDHGEHWSGLLLEAMSVTHGSVLGTARCIVSETRFVASGAVIQVMFESHQSVSPTRDCPFCSRRSETFAGHTVVVTRTPRRLRCGSMFGYPRPSRIFGRGVERGSSLRRSIHGSRGRSHGG